MPRLALLPALLLACSGPDVDAHAGRAPSTATPGPPQFLADLDQAGRRAVCERIVAAQRSDCDPTTRSFDAPLIDQCAADHPSWSCATLRIDDYERCKVAHDPAACDAAKRQAEACGLIDSLRRRCPLHIGAVTPGGPGERAGLVAGDRVRTVNGDPYGHTDLDRLLEQIATGRPLRVSVESAGRTRDVELTPDTAGERPRIGIKFTPPPECAAFLTPTAVGPIPCKFE